MSISYNDSGDLRTIAVSGRLDVEGTDSVADKLAELVKAARKGVVVDLSALKFLASIGIRTLILAAKELKARGPICTGIRESSRSARWTRRARPRPAGRARRHRRRGGRPR